MPRPWRTQHRLRMAQPRQWKNWDRNYMPVRMQVPVMSILISIRIIAIPKILPWDWHAGSFSWLRAPIIWMEKMDTIARTPNVSVPPLHPRIRTMFRSRTYWQMMLVSLHPSLVMYSLFGMMIMTVRLPMRNLKHRQHQLLWWLCRLPLLFRLLLLLEPLLWFLNKTTSCVAHTH